MGQELSLDEVNKIYPKSPGVSVFKSWFNALMKASSINPGSFFGQDEFATIPIGKQYVISMDRSNIGKVRATLNSGRRPDFKESKWAIVFQTSTIGKQPILLEMGLPGSKPVIIFKLMITGKAPRGTGKESKTPKTKQQEQVTLKIFEELLSSATSKWDQPQSGGYKKLRDTVLKKIYPDIDHPDRKDWSDHFELQFDNIRKVPQTKGIAVSNFDVYSYTEFMEFIETHVVKTGPPSAKVPGEWPVAGNISQKDSWNPADIWLVKSGNEFDKYKDRILAAPKIDVINSILREAYNKKIIVGISLKKTSPGRFNFDLVNLKNLGKPLPEIEMGTFNIDLPFDDRKKKFTKTTNNLTVKKKKGTTVGEMRIGTNTTEKGNNTYEFKPAGSAAAQLGKVPKDLMLTRIQKVLGNEYKSLPTWQEVEKKMVPQNELLNHGSRNSMWNYWNDRVKAIKGTTGFNVNKSVDEFANNMARVGVKPITKTEAAAGQIIEFAYTLSRMSSAQRDNVLQDCFYYAQKKGISVKGNRFGPFGKLH